MNMNSQQTNRAPTKRLQERRLNRLRVNFLAILYSSLLFGCTAAPIESADLHVAVPDPTVVPSIGSATPESSRPYSSDSIDTSIPGLPTPPEDPRDACQLYKLLLASAEDSQRFGIMVLSGVDLRAVADAAERYAASADDWDEMVPQLVAESPIGTYRRESYYATEALRFATQVPQDLDYLAQAIRGQVNDRPLIETAESYADPSAYASLQGMLGFDIELCGMPVR